MSPAEIISTVISGIMMVVGVTTFIVAQSRTGKKEAEEDEREYASLKEGILKANIKLDSVCGTMNEIRNDVKALTDRVGGLDTRISVVEKDMQTAFMRIDELREQKEDRHGQDR